MTDGDVITVKFTPMSDYRSCGRPTRPTSPATSPSPFLGYGRPLGAEQIAFNVRVLAPRRGARPAGRRPGRAGTATTTIEEIYFVIDGEIKVKLGDDVFMLGPRDAVLIPAGDGRARVRNRRTRAASLAMVVGDDGGPGRRRPRLDEGFWPVDSHTSNISPRGRSGMNSVAA